jgi:hypothetical protein
LRSSRAELQAAARTGSGWRLISRGALPQPVVVPGRFRHQCPHLLKLYAVPLLAFVLSDHVVEQAAAAFAQHARRIRERLPEVEIRQVALTVIRTLDDLHHGDAWQAIAADPDLIERYNAMKRAHEGGLTAAYDAAKRDFFRANFRL